MAIPLPQPLERGFIDISPSVLLITLFRKILAHTCPVKNMDPDKDVSFLGTQERKEDLPITHLTLDVSWEVEPPYGGIRYSMSIKSWDYLNRDLVFHCGSVHQLGVYDLPKCVHKGNVEARVEVERGFRNSLDERFALQCEEQSWNLKHSCKCQVGTEILLWCPFLKGRGEMTGSWTTTLAGGRGGAGHL